MKPMVSIVIPTINQVELVQQTLALLMKTDYPNYEVIVVDDGSPLHIQQRLLNAIKDFHLQVIVKKVNSGFSSTVNVGAANARGDYICIMNNDIRIVQPNWLSTMVDSAQTSQAGIVGTRLLYGDGRIGHGGILYVPSQKRFDHEYRYKPGNYGPALGAREVLGVTGALMLIDRRLWAALRGMDQRFFLSWEDVDLSLRAWAAGWRVIYNGMTYAIHPEGFTRANKRWNQWKLWVTKEMKTKQFFNQKWRRHLAQLDKFRPRNTGNISTEQAAFWRRIVNKEPLPYIPIPVSENEVGSPVYEG